MFRNYASSLHAGRGVANHGPQQLSQETPDRFTITKPKIFLSIGRKLFLGLQNLLPIKKCFFITSSQFIKKRLHLFLREASRHVVKLDPSIEIGELLESLWGRPLAVEIDFQRHVVHFIHGKNQMIIFFRDERKKNYLDQSRDFSMAFLKAGV